MRNITVFDHLAVDLQEVKDFSHISVDVTTGDIYGYWINAVYKVSVASGQVECFLGLDEICHVTTYLDVVALNINSVTQELCLVLGNGDILCVEMNSREAECVGSVDSGIKAVQWSPDQEIIALVTGKESVITMTGTFDPLNEVDFHDESFGEKQFITVGWGKKETQFHGSEGKAAAKAQKEPISSSIDDDKIPRISWRGDGSLFCVSLREQNQTRRIKIFSREGILQYTSEYVPGLEVSLSWKPSGSLIASTQVLPNKHQVVFFEKNGLRHGEFSLPFEPQEMCVPWLGWNCDSDVLAVLCKNRLTKQSHLQLWSCGNYHWYLKQNMVFDGQNSNLIINWDEEFSLRLHIIVEGARYLRFDFSWTIDHSSVYVGDAVVAVIDGDKLLLTSFQRSVIPPPLCEESITLPAAINRIVFSPHELQNIFVIMCNGDYAMLRKETDKDTHSLVKLGPLSWECEIPYINSHLSMHHWLWITEELLLSSLSFGHKSLILSIYLQSDGNMFVRKFVNLDARILSLTKICGRSEAVIQLSDGQVLKYLSSTNEVMNFGKQLPESCTSIHTCVIENSEIALGLSSRGNFYLVHEGHETVRISSGITSAFVLPKFLLMTSAQHTLQCVKMENKNCFLHVEQQKDVRRVERGSRIVVAVDTRVVLQMSRGNLETVCPRTLLLDVAARYLDTEDYRSAFELFCKHRINLNLLFDHNPEKFLASVDHFVNVVHKPSWLSLFVSELSNDDVTQTMYSSSYSGKLSRNIYDDKVGLVCDKVREAIQKRKDASLYLLPVLTTYVRKKSEEDLAAALKEAKSSKHISVDEALKYLFYMVDVNEMYNIALGLYDFDLVTLVASKSTKDPKEYLPFLNELRRLEPNYQKYNIDKHLKRYKSALCHISKCPDHFDECLDLIKTHKLYLQALELFNKSSDCYCQVAEAYGDYLVFHSKYHEAGIMYERSNKLEKALEAYQRSLDWREASVVLSQLNYSETQEADFWRSLVADLISNRDYSDAAYILTNFLNNFEEAVVVLSQGHHWVDAVRIIYQIKRLDLLETHVKPGVLEYKDHICNQLSNTRKSFQSYKARLAKLREEKRIKKKQYEDAEDEVQARPECDLYSDTSSIAASSLRTSRTDSKASTHSSRSSKNRRKLERKILSLKEGSKHEDLALIQALHQLITSILNVKSDVETLCKMLLRFEKDAEAAALQHLLDSVLCEMKDSLSEIWSADMSWPSVKTFGPDATTNSIVSSMNTSAFDRPDLHLLEPHVRYPPTMEGSQWKLQILENRS